MIGTFHTDVFFQKNKRFDLDSKEANLNNSAFPYYLLKNKFMELDVILNTQDINPLSRSDFVLYDNMFNMKDILVNNNNYLLLLESDVVRIDNWVLKLHKYFNKIFTWDDSFVDDIKYFKVNFPNKICINDNVDYKKCGLCVMIARNKVSYHPNELYSERRKVIDWFENNESNDFHLYGNAWNDNITSYLGSITGNKNTILQKYKFSFCYENACIPGYITEKIFDCFFSGTIPIYYGAPNIAYYVPKDTFIDLRDFNSYEQLYNYIKNMSDDKYYNHLNAARQFLNSNSIYPFSADCFATIISQIIYNDCMEK